VESSLLEIIELSNGDIVLQRADGEGEPLINIRFSSESKGYMPDMQMEIAKAMIQAGVQAYSEIAADRSIESESDEVGDRTLH
jgi:hypothetical protein